MPSLNAFESKVIGHFSKYFRELSNQLRAGTQLVTEEGRIVPALFPTSVLIYEFEGILAAELVGSAPEFSELQVLRAQTRSLESFLGHFVHSAEKCSNTLIKVGGEAQVIDGLSLISEVSQSYLRERYPDLIDLNCSVLIKTADNGTPDGSGTLEIDKETLRDLTLIHVLTASTLEHRVRARFFQAAFLFNNCVSSSYVQRRLQVVAPRGSTTLLGRLSSESWEDPILAANFASLAAVGQIGETTITTFLEANPSVLKKAIGGTDIKGQVEVPWMVTRPAGVKETSVKPDFLFQGVDNSWHICDFKLPLLDSKDLTAGSGSRRRLTVKVSDGVEQLYGYDAFFSHRPHREYLQEQYGIYLSDLPRLLLIVGSYENYNSERVRQATRSREGRLEILDYDTLRSMYVLSSKVGASESETS